MTILVMIMWPLMGTGYLRRGEPDLNHTIMGADRAQRRQFDHWSTWWRICSAPFGAPIAWWALLLYGSLLDVMVAIAECTWRVWDQPHRSICIWRLWKQMGSHDHGWLSVWNHDWWQASGLQNIYMDTVKAVQRLRHDLAVKVEGRQWSKMLRGNLRLFDAGNLANNISLSLCI